MEDYCAMSAICELIARFILIVNAVGWVIYFGYVGWKKLRARKPPVERLTIEQHLDRLFGKAPK